MSRIRRTIVRLAALLRGRRLNAELDEELAAHLAEATDEHRRRGLTEAEARLAAVRDFGGVQQTKEAYRDVRGFPLLDGLAQDAAYAMRILRKNPGFAAAAVVTLTLGIGANTAIFTVIDALMLRALPVQDPERLVAIGDPTAVHSWSTGTPRTDRFSFPLYREIRDRNRVFSSVLASSRIDNLQIAIDDTREDATGRLVTGNYFETLGVAPFLGRTFTAADDGVPGGDPYVVISYRYWQRRFASDPAVVGRTVRLKNYAFTIVGVAPPDFFGEVVGDRPDLWAPMMMEPLLMPGRDFLETPNTSSLLLLGRLKPGATIEQARADVSAVVRQALTETLASRLTVDDRDAVRNRLVMFDVPVSSGAKGLSRLRQQFSQPLLVLMGMVALVMLVACVNVANLMLARSAARRREISLRLALGAGPGRIVRQLLTESIVLALAGGLLGLLLARWGAAALVLLASRSTTAEPLVLGADARVLGFTAIVCVAAGLLFGLAPAVECLRTDLAPTLKDAGRDTSSGASSGRIARVLVSTQIAFGIVIVMAAWLLVHSLRNLESFDLGYRRDELVIARVDLLAGGYSGARADAVTRDLLDRLSTIPGVRHVTASVNGLFNGSESADAIRVEGYVPRGNGDQTSNDDQVGPAYFSTIGVPIVAGREITARDFATGASVAVVNETFARFYFGTANPLGRKISIVDSDHPDQPPFEIVGVARDVRDHSVRGVVPRRLYASLTSAAFAMGGALNFELRVAGRPEGIIEAVRRTIQAAGPGLVIDNVKTANALVGDTLVSQTLVATLSLSFGGLVLLLICVGLYGSVSYGVANRTREIGVRMALGATRTTIVRMVARDAGLMLAIGLVVGLPSGMAATRLFRTLLFGIGPADPLSIAAAGAAVLATATAAAILPARRATRVDPMVALRHE